MDCVRATLALTWMAHAYDRRHLSSQTSSNRRLLYWLLSCGLKFFTWGCQQLPARAVQDHRARGVLDQKPLDIPDDFPALFLVEFARLRRQQLVDLGIAILGIVALGVAGIVLDDVAVGIVDADAGDVQADRVILALQLGVPARRIQNVELADDVDLLELVGQTITAGSR